MKFGKSLSNQIEDAIPEWRDKFLSYKELKKRLKLIEPKKDSNSFSDDGVEGEESVRASKKPKLDSSEMTEAEVNFVKSLEDELEKFNTFFVEQEEEYIIRLKELQDRVAKVKVSNADMVKLWKEIVDFHGEMVLLENYSALNYTGLVKIMKKYDKRTGALLRLPFIQRVLQQPFFSLDLIYQLVKECERMLEQLFPVHRAPLAPEAIDGHELSTSVTVHKAPSETEATDGHEPSTSVTAPTDEGLLKCPMELAEIEQMKSLYMKSTLSALRILKEIRSGSSTVSAFSLPPMQASGMEDQWNKVPILEQAAK